MASCVRRRCPLPPRHQPTWSCVTKVLVVTNTTPVRMLMSGWGARPTAGRALQRRRADRKQGAESNAGCREQGRKPNARVE